MVKTDGSHSLEENMRQTLLACYTEFADILKQLAITYVSPMFVLHLNLHYRLFVGWIPIVLISKSQRTKVS